MSRAIRESVLPVLRPILLVLLPVSAAAPSASGRVHTDRHPFHMPPRCRAVPLLSDVCSALQSIVIAPFQIGVGSTGSGKVSFDEKNKAMIKAKHSPMAAVNIKLADEMDKLRQANPSSDETPAQPYDCKSGFIVPQGCEVKCSAYAKAMEEKVEKPWYIIIEVSQGLRRRCQPSRCGHCCPSRCGHGRPRSCLWAYGSVGPHTLLAAPCLASLACSPVPSLQPPKVPGAVVVHRMQTKCKVESHAQWERVAVSPFAPCEKVGCTFFRPYFWVKRRYALRDWHISDPAKESMSSMPSCPNECSEKLAGIVIPPAFGSVEPMAGVKFDITKAIAVDTLKAIKLKRANTVA